MNEIYGDTGDPGFSRGNAGNGTRRQRACGDGSRGVGPSDSTVEVPETGSREADGGFMQRARETAATHRSGRALSPLLARLTELAQRRPRERFTSLAHHLSKERLLAAYKTLKRRASPGMDGETVETYGRELGKNIENLHARLCEGKSRAQPVRRVYIPKENGKRRPIGIPSLEDKIVQAAVVSLLEPIYEEDFFDFSYGFRPRRNQHQALDAVLKPIKGGRVRWLLDVDLSGFFDGIDHNWLMRFLGHRIADRTILRLIRKWLKAGIVEDGKRVEGREGTPQGGVLSPLLANIFLHYAFDWWAEKEARKRLRGEMYITRYADDIVIGFRYRSDGELFQKLMEERLARFGLAINKEKTQLVEFGRQSAFYAKREGRRLGTFDFLGFTHVSGRTRKGEYRCWRLTARKRLKTGLAQVG